MRPDDVLRERHEGVVRESPELPEDRVDLGLRGRETARGLRHEGVPPVADGIMLLTFARYTARLTSRFAPTLPASLANVCYWKVPQSRIGVNPDLRLPPEAGTKVVLSPLHDDVS